MLSPAQRGLFIAFIHGKHYNSKERYQIDPDSGSEQVGFMTYDENKMGDWASFNISGDHSPDAVGKPFRIEHQQLDATFEKSGKLVGKATADLVVRRKGLRVVGFELFPLFKRTRTKMAISPSSCPRFLPRERRSRSRRRTKAKKRSLTPAAETIFL